MDIEQLFSNVRYNISYGDSNLSFGAPLAKTNEELADILEDIVNMLRSNSKSVVGECISCNSFIYENETHLCSTEVA